MYSLRKWMFKPKKPDESLLAEFFYTDEELNAVAAELDSFDGRKDPERCSSLVNKLRRCQDKVLTVIEKILQYVIPDKRASRDFRVKFPDDVLQDNLSGQLWFGAECLAAGSSIMNREVESASMRPLAKALTKQLDVLRSLLRDQCLRNQYTYSDKISEALVLFDKLFAEFELSYVSAMVPVKTMKEYDKLQEVMVLFCETVQRALKLGLLTQEMIDDYDPALMFTIPRLAIVCGLLVYPEGPINPDMDPMNMSEMFRPFQMLLYKIRELLWTLSHTELWLLEKSLSHSEDSFMFTSVALEEQLDRLNWFQLQSDYQKQIQGHGVTAGVSGTAGHNSSADNNNGDSKSLEDSSSSHGNSDADLSSHSDVDTSCHSNSDVDVCNISNSHEDDSSLGNSDAEMSSHSNSDEKADNCPHSNIKLSSRSNSDTEVCDHGNGSVTISNHDDNGMKSSRHDCTELKDDDHHGDERSVSQGDSDTDEMYEADKRLSVAHQDSGDSGMISMSDHVSASSAKITDDSTCHVPRLYWSRSWPPRSTSSANQSERHRHSVCCDHPKYIHNKEPLHSEYLDSSSRRSREFVFHLPYNTSSNDSTIDGAGEKSEAIDGDALVGNCESKNAQETSTEVKELPSDINCSDLTDSQENVMSEHINNSQIIYTLNGREMRTIDGQHPAAEDATTSSQIAFITGALNQFFFTDPEFEGVTPPRTPSTSSGSSASCNRGEHASKSDELKPKHHRLSSRGQCPSCISSPQRDGSSECVLETARCKLHSRENSSKSCTCPSLNSYTNSDTSSYTSDINDDEEIALAIQAAEIAARQEARARFRNSSELIHKLFVCISGVADQLQTNYASDLRHILKAVFQCNSTYVEDEMHSVHEKCSHNSDISSTSQGLHRADTDSDSNHSNTDSDSNHNVSISNQQPGDVHNQESDAGVIVPNPDCPPNWVPDDQSPSCTSCKVPFTFVRRRHHCRNCGKIFCSRCSSNSVPLPHYGHDKPVRVCNHCFIYQVTPFTVSD